MPLRTLVALKFSFLLILGGTLGTSFAKADAFQAAVKDDSTTPSTDDTKTSEAKTEDKSTASSAAQKPEETPHFWQRDSRGGFANGGRDYCCPVAVSNSFVYLAHHGFPALLSAGDGAQPQIDLINELASDDYFGTDPDNGTAPGAVLSGVRKYIEDKGFTCERLEYKGWRNVGKDQQEAVKGKRADLDWIENGIRNPNGAVWLNIGWYVKGDSDNEWKRVGGHWVTLVGCEGSDDRELLIHNPATRGNGDRADDPAKDAIHLSLVADGTLHVGNGATENASGMYRISGPGLPIDKSVDAAFLDTAIVLVVGS